MRRVLAGMVLVAALAGSVLAGGFTEGLERYVAGSPATESIKVLVTLQEQADVAALDKELGDRRATLAERHEVVISALQNTARRTQPALVRELNTLRAAGKVNGFTAYWITNAVVVNAPISVLRTLAARADVDAVDVDLVVQSILPVEPTKVPVPQGDGQRTITAGLAAINADDVWNLLGINGTGALVGGIDTGVDRTHSTLSTRWRGNNGHPTSECWLDAAGLGHTLPQDSHGHGTHTMGTMVGGNDIGVAPGAQWIATNCINMSTGSAFDNAVIASFQFMADPDGNGGTLDDVPDVVQNSWGVNESFSGYLNCDTRWWAAIDNCEAAGVCVTFSAGNEGSGAGTLRSPADRCITPYSCFSVGATDPVNGNVIAGFSSRGPSTCSPSPYPVKPEVSAPGVNTYSAAPGGGYTTMSGTSMAGPHVAGVVALMRAANPDVDVNTIKQILMSTCTDMGTVGEDNTYGWGQIDAYEAVLAVMQNYGSVAGVVTSAASGLPIAGATVDNLAGSQLATANGSGNYSMSLEAGTYSLEYASFGYVSQTQSVNVVADATTTRNVALATSPTALLYGYVYDPDNNPVAAATVDFTNVNWPSTTTNGSGYYSVAIPLGTTYVITAFASGLGGDSQTVTFNATQQLDFHLPLIEGFESGNFNSFPWSMGGNAPWIVVSDVFHDGTHSARSGAINHNQTSTMTLTLPVPSPTTISFWYKVSSEAGYDYLRFYIDGTQQNQWAGEVDWSQVTYNVPAGNHTFTWTYSKDGSVVSGSDCAWVDGIVPPEAAYPNLTASPLAFARTVAPGGTASDNLNLGNTGEGTLTWATSITTFSALTTVPTLDLAKGEVDPRPGQATRASGGPDAFGYTWEDSNEPGGPVYAFDDISAIGTTVGSGDDSNYGPFTLGFTFPYYGSDFTSVRVCTNGWLSFSSTSNSLTNQGIPNTGAPNNLVAAFWDDLNPAAGGTLKYYADGSNQRFTVQWTAVPIYGTANAQTFQIVLHADGRIVYQYQTVTAPTTCTVGIENAAGTDGLQLAFNSTYLTNNLAVEFSTTTPWLSVAPTAGSVLPGGSTTVAVNYDATELVEGTYTGQVNLTCNDVDTPTLTLPVVLTVGAVMLDPVTLSIHYVSPGQCQLTWPAAAGATSYDVYQAPFLGGTFTLLANTAATNLVVGVGNNDLRLYQVVARN